MVPLISGVVRRLKAEKRSNTAWPTWTWSMSCGAIFTSMISASAIGTMSMIVSPPPMTPPTVCTAS